jgi:hypothetical protein
LALQPGKIFLNILKNIDKILTKLYNRALAKLQFCESFLKKQQNAERFAGTSAKSTEFRKKSNIICVEGIDEHILRHKV